MRRRANNRSGQSLVESVVVLALVGIIVVSLVGGVGQRSQVRIAQANEAFEESTIAAGTPSIADSGKGDHGQPTGRGVANN